MTCYDETKVMERFLNELPRHRRDAITYTWLNESNYTIGPNMRPYPFESWLMGEEFKENHHAIASDCVCRSSYFTKEEWYAFQDMLDEVDE